MYIAHQLREGEERQRKGEAHESKQTLKGYTNIQSSRHLDAQPRELGWWVEDFVWLANSPHTSNYHVYRHEQTRT